MQSLVSGSLTGRVVYRPRKIAHRRMAVEIDPNRPYNIAITTASLFILIITGLIYRSEQNWQLWFMWLDTLAITILSIILSRRIRRGIL